MKAAVTSPSTASECIWSALDFFRRRLLATTMSASRQPTRSSSSLLAPCYPAALRPPVVHVRVKHRRSRRTLMRSSVLPPATLRDRGFSPAPLMACFLLFFTVLLAAPGDAVAAEVSIGINYGQIADNLPSPTQVSWLVRSMPVGKVKLYDADENVLNAFLDTGIDFIVGIGNGNVSAMVDPATAQAWIQDHVRPYLSSTGTQITCITVGNEVLMGNDAALKDNLLPAIKSVHGALAALGLQGQVNVTTAHSLDILGSSFPPSSGAFRPEVAPYMDIDALLDFLSTTRSPFLINTYPYFAYKADPNGVQLEYALLQPNAGMTDTTTGLHYDNMLYAQVDSVYAAIQALGHADVDVTISETGWPSRGDPDEAGATPLYAGMYMGNLMQRIKMKEGTPMRPAVPIDVYIFALFNENLKPGPASERNYGLLYPNGTPVYNVGLHGHLPPVHKHKSDATPTVVHLFALIAIASISIMLS